MKVRPSTCTSLIGAFAVLLSLACSAPRTVTTSETTVDVTSVGRFVVAPLNLGIRVPSDLKVDEDLVWDELVQEFQKMDRPVQVIDPNDAKQIWEESFTEHEDSGAKPELASVSQRFALKLVDHTDYDLLVMPSLLLRSARVRGGTAYWDGARRKLPVRSLLRTGPFDEIGGGGDRVTQWSLEGRVAAVSLQVTILTPDGLPVYKGVGGIDVLQEAKLVGSGQYGWKLVERKGAFLDRSKVRRGIEVAFVRRLPEIAAAW
jgi:hypothetical protein